MKVSVKQPFDIIYSIYEHQQLGYLFESFVVQVNHNRQLTFAHQNISSRNAKEFDKGLDDTDYELITLIDKIQQEHIFRRFLGEDHRKSKQTFLKIFDSQKGNKPAQKKILAYINEKKNKILPLLSTKKIFEMGEDGEPTWKQLTFSKPQASILFHFRKNEDNTHYYITVKLEKQKVELRNHDNYLICDHPAWIVADSKLFTFDKLLKGHKILPFFKKKFIIIQSSVEESYFNKFVCPIVSKHNIHVTGMDIKNVYENPNPKLKIHDPEQEEDTRNHQILIKLAFEYLSYSVPYKKKNEGIITKVEFIDGVYVFFRIHRMFEKENEYIALLKKKGINLEKGEALLSKATFMDCLNANQTLFASFYLEQHSSKTYFIGKATIDLEIEESKDWFDLNSSIFFGTHKVPFKIIKDRILANKSEVSLPDGKIGIIPQSWVDRFKELFVFAKVHKNQVSLSKVHLTLIQELRKETNVKTVFKKNYRRLLNFESIEEYTTPKNFKGTLRCYQLAGYQWLRFLDEYQFGGCLADDMGLGKTIQTLCLLQHQKNQGKLLPSLLVIPKSLIYNWIIEASKFTPKIKLYKHTGSMRSKDLSVFNGYDLIITTYGTVRADNDLMKEFEFNYVILDESQVIKNPSSLISKCVKKLKRSRNLILTGTPIENSTLDLWSQMNFINPELLGSKSYFLKEFLNPIEKNKNQEKLKKLITLIKPFVLRREKNQVIQDLPKKEINIKYCDMSEEQAAYYEREKNAYKTKILDMIEKEGIKKSQLILLQGLSCLRQIANHPKLVDNEYTGESGKMNVLTRMIEKIRSNKHNVLIFSQFVKHLKLISKYLEDQKIKYAYLDGSTRRRHRVVNEFMNQKEINIFLISLRAGGLGLNLTKADYVFLLDPWWNPATESQAIDRTHRIGQTQKVFAYKYITKDSVEEKILKLQQKKKKLATSLLSAEEGFVKNLTKNDISSLFE